MQLKDYLQFNKVITKDYLRIILPMLIVQGLWGISTALQTVILGHMTASAIAANSVASTLILLCVAGRWCRCDDFQPVRLENACIDHTTG